jgi:hypothetical protein
MPVANLTMRPRELGRIRMGDKGAKGQPQRLDTFRLTSPDRTLLEAAAARYGGTVRPWEGQPGQFELYTQASEIPCMVTPQEVSQWYELWSAGGCQRRCDGETVTVAVNGSMESQPCLCDPEQRQCQLVTRLSVLLHELPGMGVWRLETKGWHAATELPAAAEMLIALARRGTYTPAAIAIEQRVVKRDNQTKRFPVPVIRIACALQTLMTGEVPSERPALPDPAAKRNGNGHGPELSGRVSGAMEQHASYGAATSAGALDVPQDPKALCAGYVKELGWSGGHRARFSAALGRELPSVRELTVTHWQELATVLEAAARDKRRAYAAHAELCQIIAMDPRDRELRLDLWAVVLQRETLASSLDLTAAEWGLLADGLQARAQMERAAQGDAMDREPVGAAAIEGGL